MTPEEAGIGYAHGYLYALMGDVDEHDGPLSLTFAEHLGVHIDSHDELAAKAHDAYVQHSATAWELRKALAQHRGRT